MSPSPCRTSGSGSRPGRAHGEGRTLTEFGEVLAGPVLPAARALLGARVEAGGVSVRLTEVEAYDGTRDPGSHAYRGRTPRTAVMFGPPGFAYVYFSYGMHWCANVVCGPEGTASAVLLRAGAVLDGIERARERRPGARDRDLARGPARLTRALGVDRAADGTWLLGQGPVRLRPGDPPTADRIRTGPRVGVGGAGAQFPWRFWIDGEPTVSAYRPHAPRHRATGPGWQTGAP